MGRGVPAGLAQMGIERGDLVTLGGGAFKVTIVYWRSLGMAVITIVCNGISVMNTVKCDAYKNCTAILNHFYDNTLSIAWPIHQF